MSIWSGGRRVLAGESDNPASVSPGGAPRPGGMTTGGIYSGGGGASGEGTAPTQQYPLRPICIKPRNRGTLKNYAA